MAVFYTGYRPVLRGKNSKDSIHPYKGLGTYSNYDIHNSSQILAGAPNRDVEPGAGQFPYGLKLSRVFTGAAGETQPLDGAGSTTDNRYRPLENKAAGNNRVFKDNFGHEVNQYDATNKQTHLDDPGHPIRYVDAAGTAATFGTFGIFINKGVKGSPIADSDLGQVIPNGYDNPYGHNRVQEWRGVPSSKAIGV